MEYVWPAGAVVSSQVAVSRPQI